ncbi:threonine/homoserine/homoserine lactone efflux protein [Sulfitobacter geojensis]|nr:threonine/homoserine/homoserine lactone efflux protein [Sulfitobacter geojensis]
MDISLLTFALLAVVVVVTPGPTVLLALSNGSRFGIGSAISASWAPPFPTGSLSPRPV